MKRYVKDFILKGLIAFGFGPIIWVIVYFFLETNGIKLRPTNAEVARVGLAVAAGEMKYEELLDWILENEG